MRFLLFLLIAIGIAMLVVPLVALTASTRRARLQAERLDTALTTARVGLAEIFVCTVDDVTKHMVSTTLVEIDKDLGVNNPKPLT